MPASEQSSFTIFEAVQQPVVADFYVVFAVTGKRIRPVMHRHGLKSLGSPSDAGIALLDPAVDDLFF